MAEPDHETRETETGAWVWHGPSARYLFIPNSLVAQHDACPGCGERREDWLVWDGDRRTVQCATCGQRYWPGALGQ
mgnify:CR=1 FL=1